MDGPAVGWAQARVPSWPERQSVTCLSAIAAAEQRHGTRAGLLVAIARAESGRPVPPMPGLQPWPWVVNADGAGIYFDSQAAAVAWTAAALARGVRQIDVGCMQVNLQAHPSAFASIEDAFNPASNADYAARFLRRLQADAGNWDTATGWYHSRTPMLASAYQQRVQAIAEGRAPPASGGALGAALWQRAVAQGTLRIALAGGGVMRINLARQPSARPRAKMSACQVAAVLGDYMAASARAACARGRAPLRVAAQAG